MATSKAHGIVDLHFRQAIASIVGVKPPEFITWPSRYDGDILDMQDWCSENASHNWMTGIGIIEAAESIVWTSVNNCNIDCVKECGSCDGGGAVLFEEGCGHIKCESCEGYGIVYEET